MPHHKKRRFSIRAGHANDIEAAYRAANDVFQVLDLGCGRGRYHEDMKESIESIGDKEVEIIGLDHNIEALEDAYQAEDFLVADAVSDSKEDTLSNYLPFEDESFDLVYSSHLFCQLDSSELKTVKERAERVLKDTGKQVHEV